MLFERNHSSGRALNKAAICLALAVFIAAPSALLRPVFGEDAPTESQQIDPKAAYEAGLKQFNAKDYAGARKNLEIARDAGYKPGWFQPAPAKLLADLDKREADAAAAAKKAEEDAAAKATADDSKAKAKEARDAYMAGREQYRKGDWIAARKNLESARDAGFKPGFMEEAPASILAKIDKGEAEYLAKHPAPAPESMPSPVVEAPAPAPVVEAPAPAPVPAPAPAPVVDAPAPAPVVEAPTPAPATAAPSVALTPAERALETTANYERIRTQHRSFESQRKVTEASKAQSENRIEDALRLYTEASELDPANSAAAAGRDELLTLLGRQRAVAPTLDLRANEIRSRRQAINWQIDSALEQAQAAIGQNEFAAAQVKIESARVARGADTAIFTREDIAGFDARIANAQVALDRAKTVKEDQDRAKAISDAAREQSAKLIQQQKERDSTVAELVKNARQLIDDQKWPEAMAVIDHVRALDPHNQYANDVRPFIKDKAQVAMQRKNRERFDEEFVKQLVSAEEQKIPYFTIMSYAENWPDISRKRDLQVAEERGGGTEDSAIQAMLDRRLPEVRFNANSFSDVIDFLRDVSGANIYVDWAALERASISKDAPVTARLRDIKFSKALELIFKNVSGEEEERRLGYTIDEGVITISTKKELDKNVLTRQYDINDLLFVAPDFENAPQLSLSNSGGGGGRGGGGGGGGNLFGGGGGTGGAADQELAGSTREEITEEIKKYITDNVATDTWKDNGGDVGSISSSKLRALLLVTQTPENHRQIQTLLDNLRKSQAIQVSIETRFLTVQRNYLEDIGVDADFTFNGFYRNASGQPDPSLGRSWSNKFGPLGFAQNQVTDNSTFIDDNGNITNNSNGTTRVLDWASRVGNAGVPGSIATNSTDYPSPLVIQGSFLDNFTVNFLVRAVEANVNSTSLTAPRLTLFDGQRANLVVTTEQAYVGDLTPVVSSGAALFDPEPDTIQSGIVLDVRATVSPDRKYVYMTLQPQLSRVRALVPFSVSASVTPVATGTGAVVSQPTVITGQLQLPTSDIVTVRTSCSVPDGATLLLGGQTLAGETEREQGVPILSKIPFLKRLFTNRANSQDEQILLILVKPTILIQRELENEQFPMLSTKLGR